MIPEDFELLGKDEIEAIVNPPIERRESNRVPFRTAHRLAPISNGKQGAFRVVNCSDLSTGGISFLLDAPPDFDQFIVLIELGSTPLKLMGDVVGVEEMSGLSLYLVRCRFTARLES